jgi:hypothetical protein
LLHILVADTSLLSLLSSVAVCSAVFSAFCCCALWQALFEQILAGLLSRVAEGNGRVPSCLLPVLDVVQQTAVCTSEHML